MSDLLPVFEAPETRRVWLVAAHGGAGCSTIYESDPRFYADAGRALPHCSTSPSRVVVCAMGTVRGLEAAQGLLREARDGGWGSTLLAGLVVTVPVAKEPKVLSDARKLVMSAAPRAWTLPFIPGLAVEGVPQKFPRAYTKLVRELGEFLNASNT